MSTFSENEIIGVSSAIVSHLDARPVAAFSLSEIHDFWNEWPKKPDPIQATEIALARLVDEGMVERIEDQARLLWRRIKS